jgi:putative membrane protein
VVKRAGCEGRGKNINLPLLPFPKLPITHYQLPLLMLNFFLTWLVSAVSLVVTAKLVPGIEISSFGVAAVAAIVMGLVNAIVRPILVLFTLPLTILSLGAFLLVVNAIVFSLVAYLSPAGFIVHGFWSAFFGAIVLSIVSSVLGGFVVKNDSSSG